MKSDVFVVRASPSARSIRVCTQDVVVDQHVVRAHCLGALCVRFNRTRIVAHFVMWKDDSECEKRMQTIRDEFDKPL